MFITNNNNNMESTNKAKTISLNLGLVNICFFFISINIMNVFENSV